MRTRPSLGVARCLLDLPPGRTGLEGFVAPAVHASYLHASGVGSPEAVVAAAGVTSP